MKKLWVKILIFAVLVGATVWAGKGIFKYSIFSTHDGDHHIARSFDAVQTFREGGFPLRWAGSLNYLCGVPIYNFYYPLLYYLVILGNAVFNNIIFSLKIIYFLSLLVGTLGFYFWAKEETEKEIPAIAGALVYLFAPYRFVLIFVRGSPEYLAFAILPVVLFLFSRAFHSKGNKFILYAFLGSVVGAILTISHNFTAMFLMPIILLYIVVKIILLKLDIRKIGWMALSFIGAFGMGSFFIGPALMEQKFTQIGGNFLMWRDHFPELWQLWNSKWGYFYSSSGTINDGMSFMLGYAQWAILAFSTLFILFRLFKSKFKMGTFIKENVWILIFFLGTLFTIYLILPWSIPIWEKIRLLQEIQFSWRLLGVAVFTIAALFVFVLDKIKSKQIIVVLGIGISLFAVVAERNHMLPQPVSSQDLYKYADFEKLYQHRYSTTTLGDEVIAPSATGACWFDVPLVATEKEEIKYSIVERGNTFGSVKFDFPDNPKGKIITTGLGYFPGIYRFEINGEPTTYNDCGGRVCFNSSDVVSGPNFLSWKVGESKIETFFDWVSLSFILLWILIFVYKVYFERLSGKQKLHYLLLLLIFFVFVFFRTYNLRDRIGFGWDQERDARAAVNILSGNFTLIGPRVQGPSGFFLPPYFFYLLAPFYALGHLSAYSVAGFIVFWSVLSFGVGYWAISRIFGQKTAVYFLALWGVSNLAISIDTIAWNPVVIPLLMLLLIYLYYIYLTKKKQLYIFLMGLTFGLGISFHLQFLFVFPFLVPLLIDIFKSKKFSGFVRLVIGVAIPFLPILIFDLRHNFLNFRLALQFSSTNGFTGNRVFYVWSRVASFMTGINTTNLLGYAVYILVSLGLIVLAIKLKNVIQKKMFFGLGLTWILSLPLFYFLIKNPSEYYFNYLLVIFLLLIASVLNLMKRVGFVIGVILAVYLALGSITLLKSYNYYLTEKVNAVLFLKKVTQNSAPFNVSFDVPFNEDTGYKYLLDYYKVKYSGNPKDPLIEFVIPPVKKPGSFFLGKIGLYIPPSWIKDNWVK